MDVQTLDVEMESPSYAENNTAPTAIAGAEARHPRMVSTEIGDAPAALTSLDESDISPRVLTDLACKLAATVSQFDTVWAASRLRLPLQLTEQLLWHLKEEKLLTVLGQEGTFCYRYSLTDSGRQHALRLMEICGYVGPAPVSLESYTAMLTRGSRAESQITIESVRQALADLVLPEDTLQIASLAAASGRSLFLFGPPGNGKTSLGRAIHQVMRGPMWLPYGIAVGDTVIRLYDSHCHHRLETPSDMEGMTDQRWIRIQRPLIVSGGEMTIDELDLTFSPSLRFYEAPPHLKANGGVLLIDDFGRQRIEPHALLNRWIIPLEHRIDHLTLHSGQKIVVPFEVFLVVATNLKVSDVADPAFLRRMGYRLHLVPPTKQQYIEIFQAYARELGLEVPDEMMRYVLERYRCEKREFRASEPRDLLERVIDISRLRREPPALQPSTFDLAWKGYFGGIDSSLTERSASESEIG